MACLRNPVRMTRSARRHAWTYISVKGEHNTVAAEVVEAPGVVEVEVKVNRVEQLPTQQMQAMITLMRVP